MCPLSVKIIAVLGMIYSGLTAIPKALVLLNPEIYESTKNLVEAISEQGMFTVPFSVQITHSILGVLVIFISSLYMLKGRSWALYLLTGWIAASLVITLMVAGLSSYVLIKLPLTILILGILYTGKSRAYLLGNRSVVHA